MQVIEEQYESARIDRLKRFLHSEQEQGKTKPFEVFIDGIKVIAKTTELHRFNDFKDQIDKDTRNVTIVVFEGEKTNRNMKYSFAYYPESNKVGEVQSLNGLEPKSITELIQEKLDERDKQYKIDRLQEKVSSLESQLKEAEEWAADLEQEVLNLKDGKQKKTVHFGEMAGYMLSGIIKQNPQLLSKLPPQASEVLSGILGVNLDSNSEQLNAPAESEASFKPKGSNNESPSLNEDEKGWLEYGKMVQSQLDKEQSQKLFAILQEFQIAPALIETVFQLLQQKQ